MRERPILFSGPMVRAILAGTKTQTRRPVKLKVGNDNRFPIGRNTVMNIRDPRAVEYGPFGQTGDRLWVREEWHITGSSKHHSEPFQRIHVAYRPHSTAAIERGYRLDGKTFRLDPDTPYPCSSTPSHRKDGAIRWRPSIHMPRWACRLVLEIVSVRVERLQEISEEDALAEGVSLAWYSREHDIDGFYESYREAFQDAWNPIYAAKGQGWDANPWVWVVEFKRAEAPA